MLNITHVKHRNECHYLRRPMKETPGSRLIELQRLASLSNEDLADEIGVHVKTISYWRRDKQVPEDAQLERIVKALKKRGVHTTAAAIRYGPQNQVVPDVTIITAPESRADEVKHLLQQTRELAARYNIRRAQGAPDDELRRIARSLQAAIRNVLEAKTDDTELLDHLVDSFFGLFTSESEPPRSESPASGKNAANDRDRPRRQ